MANIQADSVASDLLFANFNQDSTSLAVGSRHGYRLFSLSSVDRLEQIHDNEGTIRDVCLVERLFSSSLVAIVSLNSPRKLKVCHFKKGTEICNYSYSNTILAVKLNRLRLVVVLEESLYVHNIRDMKVLHTIRDTPSNLKGICALSASSDNSLLAYPGSPHTGEVQIFDVTNLKAVTMIHAHNNPLAAMAFNKEASRLATASDKGTVIRVFSVPDGKKLFEFRRGVKRCVSINSLSFSSNAMFLTASSNTETVHIFKLDLSSAASSPQSVAPTRNGYQSSDVANNNKHDSSWMDYFNKVLTTSSNYLPIQVTDILNQDRAFATVKLPTACRKNICTLAVIQKLLRVIVASTDGYLYIYNLDTEEGGECTLIRQHRLNIESGFITRQSPTPISPSSYAEATRGQQTVPKIKDRSGSTGSSASSSSDSTFSNVSKSDSSPGRVRYTHSPKGRLKGMIDEHELAEDLPLDDESEFPPMTMYCE
uniref:WD repeat domain phosphoinositide-interacting protein 2-like n=1 Tax=Styela clava TaxID=7725 RepID=UPI001939F097|nr:WD repeat domain phosphoinositide-interacting protein 2-like [Styela clava]